MKRKISNIEHFLAELNYTELDEVMNIITSLKSSKRSEHLRMLGEKAAAARKRAIERFKKLEPKIIKWILGNVSSGDFVRCKNYRGIKKIIEFNGESTVHAMCGSFDRDGNFVPNGYGSESYLTNVTHVLRDKKWIAIKDKIQ